MDSSTLRIPVDSRYMCDGHYAVLLSASLGGSDLQPAELADALGMADADVINDLLARGICLPIFFGGDCALDGKTLFVIGELDAEHQAAWLWRLTGTLNIPCGKLILLTGGGVPEDMERAVSLQPPNPDYCIHQIIDVPAGRYRVDVLAYARSTTAALMEFDTDEWDGEGEIEDRLEARYPQLPRVAERYVIHLRACAENLPLPALVEDINWPGLFERRAGLPMHE